MKAILYLIIGKSGSGKNTLKKELLKLGVEPLNECTTRPARPGEIDGVDYFFLTEKEFHEGTIIGKRHFKTEYGNWHFGIMKEEVEEDKLYCLVICPKQYEEVVTYYIDKADIIPIWVYTDDEQRILNIILREEQKASPDYTEICRRIKSDAIDFSEESEMIQKIKTESYPVYNLFDETLLNIAKELFYDRNYLAFYESITRENEREALK
ncbi:hypothetical protein [Hungatella hathewayi]|uniref:hypothetical protein n=1 Tax=Hungatella hathewayi TaxID=154046 RepID=UPI0035650511